MMYVLVQQFSVIFIQDFYIKVSEFFFQLENISFCPFHAKERRKKEIIFIEMQVSLKSVLE